MHPPQKKTALPAKKQKFKLHRKCKYEHTNKLNSLTFQRKITLDGLTITSKNQKKKEKKENGDWFDLH